MVLYTIRYSVTMKKSLVGLLSALLLVLAPTAQAQVKNQEIQGSVIEFGVEAAVPNAVISLASGGKVLATTDAQGRFRITAAAGSSLRIRALGFTDMVVAARDGMRVALRAETTELDEIVVVGFGTQKKSNVTGSIAQVKAKDLESMSLFRVEQALQGRTAGVQVTQSSGQPGAGSVVRIRGTASINGSDPLYVVDGVVIGGGIDYLNPNDIETIEVLKDAASAAIYGARGANGVIIVTTKSGKGAAGQMNVTVSGYRGLQNPWRKVSALNATEYATLQNEMAGAAGQAIPYLDPRSLGEGTDWQEAIFNRNAPVEALDVSMSQSSKDGSYFASVGRFRQEGIVAPGRSNFERITARLNTTNQVHRAIKVGMSTAYTHNTSQSVAENTEFGSPLGRALNMDPLTPVYETNPQLLSGSPYTVGGVLRRNLVRDEGGIYAVSPRVTSEVVNPLAAILTNTNVGWSDKIVHQSYADLNLGGGFSARSSMGIDLAFYGGNGFIPAYYLNATNFLDTNLVTQNFNRAFSWMWDNTLNYTKEFGAHHIDAVVGHSAQEVNGSFMGGSKRDVPTDEFGFATISYARNAESERVYGGKWERYAIESYFGRVNYDYDDRYLATVILRGDASSRFGPNFRWGYFPSLSTGWNLHKESWWSSNLITGLKLRLGYGMSGNDAAGSLEYAATISGGRNYSFGYNEFMQNGTSPSQIANPDLRWERVGQANLGADIRWGKYLYTNIDLYHRATYDMKTRPVLPDYVGNNAPTANVGRMLNMGIDFEAGYDRSFSLDRSIRIAGNVSYLRNEVVYLGNEGGYLPGQRWGPQGLEITRIQEGLPIGYFFGYMADGVFQNSAEVDAHINAEGGLLQPDAVAGDFRFKDVNNDGILNADDRTIIGNPTPDFAFGATLNARFGGWDAVLFVQGVAGNQIYNATRRYDLPSANMNASALDRWTGEGSSDHYARLTALDKNTNFARSSSFYVEDGSFLRIKTAQIGYTLPEALAAKIGLKRCRLYYSGINLLTLTKYRGFDPEIGNGFGVDRGIYPQARTHSIGFSTSLN